MREIGKFRGKRLDNGEWVYGYYRYDTYKGVHQICEQRCKGDIDLPYWEYHEVDPETVAEISTPTQNCLRKRDEKEAKVDL